MKTMVRNVARAIGFDIVRHRPGGWPHDVSAEDQKLLQPVAPFTMTSAERQIALVQAVRYLVRRKIPGSFVECGVWRGGSTMAAALTLLQEGDTGRDLYLFDTFEGMSPPTDEDKTADGVLAKKQLDRLEKGTGIWCYASLEDVQANMASTKYPSERVHFVKGPVEETIPAQFPNAPIALLRLDTDWYESTKHEMIHLFPLLQEGGVLIIDDYGHWQGARKAIDEYLAGQEKSYYLHRIDYTGRILIKN
jgi:O-methyltransferase